MVVVVAFQEAKPEAELPVVLDLAGEPQSLAAGGLAPRAARRVEAVGPKEAFRGHAEHVVGGGAADELRVRVEDDPRVVPAGGGLDVGRPRELLQLPTAVAANHGLELEPIIVGRAPRTLP